MIGSTAERFNKGQVDFSLVAVLQHLLVARPIASPQAEAGVIIDCDKMPIGILLYVICVKLNLVLQAVLLIFMLRADLAIRRHPKPLLPYWPGFFIHGNLQYIFGHNKTSVFPASARAV